MKNPTTTVIEALKLALAAQGAVGVKGLGTLVLVRQPAKFQPNNSKIDPPKAGIAFISGQAGNDEAVVAQLCKLGFNTSQSFGLWHDAQSEWAFRLKHGNAVSLPGIGDWQKGLDGSVRFVPQGTIQDSTLFGLSPIDANPIVHEKGKIIQLPEVPIGKALRYAAAAALFAGLAWIPATQLMNSSSGLSLSVTNLVGTQHEQTYVPRSFNDSVHWADVVDQSPAEMPISAPDAPRSFGQFDVVCATYATQAEAMAKVNLLAERGFMAKLAGQQNGQFVVSYGTYANESEAAGMLASVRITNTEAFVWAH